METKKLILRNIFCLLGKAELSKRQKEKRSEDEIMNSDNKGSEIILWQKRKCKDLGFNRRKRQNYFLNFFFAFVLLCTIKILQVKIFKNIKMPVT